MTNIKEKTEQKRKELSKFADKLFPVLSSPELVRVALEFEHNLK